jgi:RNA 2',3'-cyclic 3'-phosphodiesterase
MRRQNETPAKVERMRLFVALDVPEAVRDALEVLARRFEKIYRGARWVRLTSAHVTLKFIGEVPIERVEDMRLALRQVTSGPVELRFAGLGFFPNARRPRVFWAGVHGPESHATSGTEPQGLSELGRLAGAVEAVLEPLGIAHEKREFSPHITLARFGSTDGLDSLRARAGELTNSEFGSALASEFHLYRSVLKRTGAEYTRLDTYRLSGEHTP